MPVACLQFAFAAELLIVMLTPANSLLLRTRTRKSRVSAYCKSLAMILLNCRNRFLRCISSRGKLGKHLALGKARTLSLETKSAVTERLCATWPQNDTVVTQIDDLIRDDADGIAEQEEDER